MGLLSGNGVGAYKSVDRTNFVCTAGQTVFTLSQGYNIGDVDVYMNGIKLVEGDDFYAVNGTTITLNSGANAGDALAVVSYNQFNVANTYTKSEADTRYMVATGGNPMTSYLRTPNYGVSSWSDSANASLEASQGAGTQGAAVKVHGRSVATFGGDIHYVSDTRGAGGGHKFYGYNGTIASNYMSIDTVGRVNTPNQPLWVARQTQTNGVSTASSTKMTWWDVLYNIGSNWNTTNHRFTAPITGVYQVTMQGIKYPMSGALHVDIWKNGSVQSQYRARAEEASGYNQYSVTCFIQLNLNDYIEFYFFGDGGLHADHGTFSIRLVQ
jgi:hypothetical protein